jgi:hypothetical protein
MELDFDDVVVFLFLQYAFIRLAAARRADVLIRRRGFAETDGEGVSIATGGVSGAEDA